MKLLDIIIKEISLVKSQKIALLLIFLYPFLAIGLLGSSFSGIDITKAQSVSVGVVNELDFESSITESIIGYEGLNLQEINDENILIEKLKTKEILVGLKLSAPSENSQIKVDLFYDNSNLLSSRFFMEIAKALVQRVTIVMTQERLGEIWRTISELGENIDSEKNQINEFKLQLNEAEDALNSLETKLNSLSIADPNRDITGELAEFKVSFDELKNEFEDVSEKADEYEQTIGIILSSMNSQIDFLDERINDLESEKEGKTEEEQEVIQNQIDNLENFRGDIVSWRSDLDEINDLVKEIGDEKSSLNTTLDKSDQLFNEISSETAILEDSLNEVRTLISESRNSKDEIEEKLNRSSAMLSKFSNQIIAFSEIDPKVLAQPVVFYERKIFDVDPFGILVANATAIVLILTCMLLTSIIVILERNQNVSLRLILSPTSKFILYFGKIIGQLLISLVEAMIIFIVAFVGFGIDTISILPELLIATTIISLSFISLGLLIAAFMKNQSTAILTSLLLIVPMLFLSGVILPLEFMESFMQQISYFLPLTVANNLLIGLLIKGFSFFELGLEIAILLSITLIIFAIVVLKKETYN